LHYSPFRPPVEEVRRALFNKESSDLVQPPKNPSTRDMLVLPDRPVPYHPGNINGMLPNRDNVELLSPTRKAKTYANRKAPSGYFSPTKESKTASIDYKKYSEQKENFKKELSPIFNRRSPVKSIAKQLRDSSPERRPRTLRSNKLVNKDSMRSHEESPKRLRSSIDSLGSAQGSSQIQRLDFRRSPFRHRNQIEQLESSRDYSLYNNSSSYIENIVIGFFKQNNIPGFTSYLSESREQHNLSLKCQSLKTQDHYKKGKSVRLPFDPKRSIFL